MRRVSPNYVVAVFDQPGLRHTPIMSVPYPEGLIDPWLTRLCGVLERVAGEFGCAPVVISGYRSPLFNIATGHKAAHDTHAQGLAADFVVPGVAPDDVVLTLWDLAEHEHELLIGGIHRHRHFTHVDVRPIDRRYPAYRDEPCMPLLPRVRKPTVCLGCHLGWDECRCKELRTIEPSKEGSCGA